MDIQKLIKDEKLRAMISESWAISWPMTFIMLYEFIIGLSDVYIAGKFGKIAQAAYGFAFQLYFVFIIIGIALSIGIVSVVSRLYASKKPAEFDAAVNSSLVMVTAFGLIFGAAGLIFSKGLINALNLPPEMKAYAIPFMRIYSLAFLFDYILMSINGILRACGMIKKSLWTMTAVCILNVALNFLLAFGTPCGFNGIAFATAISLFVGAVLSLWYIRRFIRNFSVSLAIIKSILGISWPSALLQASWQLGYLVLFLILSLLPRNNVEIMAALTNGLKIESAIFLPAIAFSMANSVIIGNLLGKREGGNAFKGGIITAIMGVAVVSVLTLMVMLNAGHIASFLSDNGVVINESVRYIYIALISEPVMAWGSILVGGLNGAGDTMGVMVITTLSIWLVRLPLSYLFGIYYGFGAIAVWWSMNCSILAQAIFISRRYFKKRWADREIGLQNIIQKGGL